MEVARPIPRVMRFGVFELDPVAGELRKSGLQIRLPDQSLKILVMLVKRPGTVVTREELRHELWPDGTFVEFDHSLNAAINRLRAALNDSAETPRFVETVTHRGYRFIATVDGSPAAAETQLSPHAVGVTNEPHSQKRYGPALTGRALGVALAGLLITLAVAWHTHRGVGAPRIQSLAVLPLENLSRDPEQEYFADGVTEDLIADLAQISALRVISRTSVMQYKRARKPLPQIARELNVDAVVEGVIEHSGDKVRITAQLIYAPADRHLWAKSYERQLRDVLALQDEVARDIADEIRVKLTPREKEALTITPAVNPAAHEAYLKGRFFSRRGTTEGSQKGLEYFREAVEIDPGFALGYAGLANSYMRLGNTSSMPSKEAYEKAKAAAQKALEIDDTLAEAHHALAVIKHMYEYDQAGAEREFKRGMELNPNLAGVHAAYSLYLDHMLRCDEAVAEAKTAEQLDPLSPEGNIRIGIAFVCGRRYDQAIEHFQKDLHSDPTNYMARYWLANAYMGQGKYEAAIAEDQRLALNEGLPGMDTRGQLALIYALAGKKREAIKILTDLKEKHSREYVRPHMIAEIYAALGENDQAMEWLEKSYEERDDWIVWTRMYVGVRFQGPLPSDPRFQDLMRRVGLPP
jgi:TolB-like protein/DNA-binding winged helix-turn-helix (wHTH) protein/Tfp pilus assembly protein PilF